MPKPFLNTPPCRARKLLILNTGCWKKPNCSACQNQKALTGRIALITGSAGGIGKAIAQKFADEGACIVVNDNDADRLASCPRESFTRQYGKDVFTDVVLDVTSAADIKKAYSAARWLLVALISL